MNFQPDVDKIWKGLNSNLQPIDENQPMTVSAIVDQSPFVVKKLTIQTKNIIKVEVRFFDEFDAQLGPDGTVS